MIKKIFKRLHSNYLYYRFKHLYEKDPRLAAIGLYKKIYGRKSILNIDEPKNLIEKITWLELNTDTSLWTQCADKYRMREYVKQCGLSAYLPKLYGNWDNPDNINFSKLPNEFVLKANNGCGTVKIVHDKRIINDKKIKIELKRWLEKPFGYMGAQKHYLSIKPCIIAEELLHQNEEQKKISPSSLIDYKIWCFNGVPDCILIVHNRTSNNYLLDIYNTNWERIPNALKHNHSFEGNGPICPKPKCLQELLNLSSKLSKPFPEVRVDFYVIDDRPYIGELTFSTGYGYFTDEFYDYLGEKCDISDFKNQKIKN